MAEALFVARHMKNFIDACERAAPRMPPPIIYFHNAIVEMYVACVGVEEGVERETGRWFIKWTFARWMRQNKTLSILENFRQNINSAFYIKYTYNYAYLLENNETRLFVINR